MTAPHRTTLTGAFPRTEELVAATRDLDRGRITPAAAEAMFAAAEERVRSVEASLALDNRTGGYLRWQDLFRPFTAAWNGASVGPLTRFFETNTFVRQPVFDTVPTPGRSALGPWLPRGPDARAIVPGPYTFAALADLRYAGGDRDRGMRDIAEALAQELAHLGSARPGHIQFQEPLLGYLPFDRDPAALEGAYRRLAEATRGSTSTVWTFFGDGARSLPVLRRLPVDVLGFDLFESEFPPGADLGGKGLGLGVIESRTTLPENPEEIARIARALEAQLRPPSVWLGPSPPLDLLPFDAAVGKLALLPRLKEVLSS